MYAFLGLGPHADNRRIGLAAQVVASTSTEYVPVIFLTQVAVVVPAQTQTTTAAGMEHADQTAVGLELEVSERKKKIDYVSSVRCKEFLQVSAQAEQNGFQSLPQLSEISRDSEVKYKFS
jgi:hypothetical protein